MLKNIDKILFYWTIAGEIVPNIILSVTEPLTIAGRITNILLPLGLIGLTACISKHIGKTVLCLLPYTVLAAFQIVLLSLYSNGIISVDMFLNVLTTNSTEVFELISRLWPSLIAVTVLYLFPLVAGGYCIYKDNNLSDKFLKLNRNIWGITTVAGIISLACSYGTSKDYDVRLDLYPVNVGYNIYLTYVRYEQSAHYYDTSANFKFNAKTTHDEDVDETYIIIIGETARAENWELSGYNRSTNPRLSQRNDLIVADKAFSESNTTHKSVPMLMSNVDAQTFDTELHKVKSLITAYKEAGFYTTFISNQMPNHSFIDYFGNEADTTIFIRLQAQQHNTKGDDAILTYLKQSLESDKKKHLIVLHTYGSHFDYRDRYSEQDRIFRPDNFDKASKATREALINAYDNSIVATDRLINSIIEMVENDKSVGAVLYTSDHGEDIFDDGARFLHASPLPTIHQLHVPLIIWLSKEYINRFPEIDKCLRINSNKYISTSRSFCPTALAIGGIKANCIDFSHDLSSINYVANSLYYLNDHNVPVPLTSLLK